MLTIFSIHVAGVPPESARDVHHATIGLVAAGRFEVLAGKVEMLQVAP
jgi:hypothetical protein